MSLHSYDRGPGGQRFVNGEDQLGRAARPQVAAAIGRYARALGVIAIVTLAAFLFTPLVGAHTTALVYLLTVVLLALFVGRGPTLAAAAMSAMLWDFFFL